MQAALFGALTSAKFLIPLVFLATGLYVHFRGRERYPILRQLTGMSTALAPLL